MKAVVFDPRALRALQTLPKPARTKIVDKLERYTETGAGDLKALVGRPGKRLRIGRYRAVFVEGDDEIRVFAVGDRRDVYD